MSSCLLYTSMEVNDSRAEVDEETYRKVLELSLIHIFLDSIYQAGMDVDTDLASEKERVMAISRSNQYLRLIDEAVELMRKYHPQGERYYWVLYYSYLSASKPENIDEILDKLEQHFPQYTRVHRTTYFRWREQAFEAVGSILWGYEGESEQILKLVCARCV